MNQIILCVVLLAGTNFVSSNESEGQLSPPVLPMDGIQQEARIIQGYTAQAKQFPHMVSLLNRHPNKYTLCGGSVISNNFILTAAHCCTGVLSTTVGFGTIDRNKPYIQAVASKPIIHENYNPKSLNNDVALWKLPITLEYDSFIQPVRLPRQSQNNEKSFLERTATVSGFGRYSTSSSTSSQVLRYVFVRVIENSLCAKTYGSNTIQSFTLCSFGYEEDEQGTCHGDSGSPLILQEGNVNTQIGVTSFVSSKGCGLKKPVGFARVSYYLPWINKNTGIPLRP